MMFLGLWMICKARLLTFFWFWFIIYLLNFLKMEKNEKIELRGRIEELLPSGTFRVKLESGQIIIAHLAGKMRLNKIRLSLGDEVKVEVTPYDLTKGRITFRY